MAFKDGFASGWLFSTAIAVVGALATFSAFIAFTTITAIAVTTMAFARLPLLFAALVRAWRSTLPGTLRLGLLTGWIQGLRRVVRHCAYHVIPAAFGAVITALATAAIALTATRTTTLTALATLCTCRALTLWCVRTLLRLATHGCGHSRLVGECQVLLYRVALQAFTIALAATLCAFTTTFTAVAATFTGLAWFTLFAAFTRFTGFATFRALC